MGKNKLQNTQNFQTGCDKDKVSKILKTLKR